MSFCSALQSAAHFCWLLVEVRFFAAISFFINESARFWDFINVVGKLSYLLLMFVLKFLLHAFHRDFNVEIITMYTKDCTTILNLLWKSCRVRKLFSSFLKYFTLPILWPCHAFNIEGCSSVLIGELCQILCSSNWLLEVMHSSKFVSDHNSRISFMNFPELLKIF